MAGFSGTPTNGAAPLVVTFANLSSNATNYVWNFGDGNTLVTGGGTNVTDTYTNAGSYTVILSAIGLGTTNSLTNTAYIVVSNPPPVAGFSGTPTNLFVTQAVVFTNTSTGSYTNSAWSFGDGNAATNTTGANVTNTYAAAGSYTVQLIVSGTGGANTNTQGGYLVVRPRPGLGRPVVAGGTNFVFERDERRGGGVLLGVEFDERGAGAGKLDAAGDEHVQSRRKLQLHQHVAHKQGAVLPVEITTLRPGRHQVVDSPRRDGHTPSLPPLFLRAGFGKVAVDASPVKLYKSANEEA